MDELLMVMEIDGLTGKVSERELNAEEILERESSEALALARKAEAESKAAARESALAKLAELGLTAEEIAAL